MRRSKGPLAHALALTVCLALTSASVGGQSGPVLPDTRPLTWEGDLSARMVSGIDRFLMRKLEESTELRARHWRRDFSSRGAYEKSVQSNRERFRRIIGVVGQRQRVSMERFAVSGDRSLVAETEAYRIWQVRWSVLDGVWGEGLLLEPLVPPVAHVVALPDADQTPEDLAGLTDRLGRSSQFARRLVESGCQVIVPTLISRSNDFSGNPSLSIAEELQTVRSPMTNAPHREWLYRMAYEMGRHVIGYEVQKVRAAVDWITARYGQEAAIGVIGYGEGGLVAFYSAAADTRIDATLVSGYFGPRLEIWKEPIYRNVWALLHEFGDAEIGSLIQPRALVVEHSLVPDVSGPPPARQGQRATAAPGGLTTWPAPLVEQEFNRLLAWNTKLSPKDPTVRLVVGEGRLGTVPVGSQESLAAFLRFLHVDHEGAGPDGAQPRDARKHFDPRERQCRQVRQIEDHIQALLRVSGRAREQFFLDRMPSGSSRDFAAAAREYRRLFWEDVIGKVTDPRLAPNPRTRRVYDRPEWTGYEVVLDVWADVFAWGVLLLPTDLQPGERRPVVVAQHGLEGVPSDVIEIEGSRNYEAYRAFAARLAERGFIVFAPHNPYRGEDAFRVLQRKANPLKLSLFSVIIGQHQQLLQWLETLPFVDGERIAFYGLSYGGKTAMRVPAVVEDYALSICSGDFNEWIWKNVTVDWPNSYMFTNEYEMYEFNLGMTFNYAEMVYLIFPRPFMVERGHRDGVGLDEWVAHEYAKVRRLYEELGQGRRTAIEFFNGGHEIHGVGTFTFLEEQLGWSRDRRQR